MMQAGDPAPDGFADAVLAARLLAIDPLLGGMILRGGGDARDAVVALVGKDFTLRRVPANVDTDRLLGGLDLGATLALGRPVAQRGLLAQADGGAVLLSSAERLGDIVVAQVAAALDTGMVETQRDGVSTADAARFVVLAIDDGFDDERVAMPLAERLAFRFDLSAEAVGDIPLRGDATGAWPQIGQAQIEALVATAAVLGIDSIRAPMLAARAAVALARVEGRGGVTDADVATAARLVLGPRATRLPSSEAPPEETVTALPADAPGEGGQDEIRQLEDVVLEAVLANMPRDILAAIALGGQHRGRASRSHGKGQKRRSPSRGRPVGVRAGVPRGGLRLSLIDTLRAAAPWQRLRGRDDARIRIRKDDLRIRRFETCAEATTIFAVDASGSSALARLAEAKGAVELLLGEAYVKRAQVALVAFRGAGAELLLPPTRSLARARRALAELPGGGGTPIAAGLAAALDLAEAARDKGRTPFLVVLSDGRANIALDGGSDRKTAADDAEAAARAIGAAGIAGAFVDISPRPRAEGERLAGAMGARYLPLPRADAGAMHAAVRAVQPA